MRLFRLGIVVCCTVSLAIVFNGCSSQKSLTIETVTQYSTYETPKPRMLSSSDPALKWIQFQDRINRELNQKIPQMGLSYSRTNPDLSFYVYGLGSNLAQRPIFSYRSSGYDINGDLIPSLTGISEGSLILDIVDPVNNSLMWRGIVGFPMDNETKAYQALPDAIRVLLAKGSQALTQQS